MNKKFLLIALSILIAGCGNAEQPQKQNGVSQISIDSAQVNTSTRKDSSSLNGLYKSGLRESFVELTQMSGKSGHGANYTYLESRDCYDRAAAEYRHLSGSDYRATYTGGVAGITYTEKVGLIAKEDHLVIKSYEEGQQYSLDRVSPSDYPLVPVCDASAD